LGKDSLPMTGAERGRQQGAPTVDGVLTKEILQVIKALAKEKGLEQDAIKAAIEESIIHVITRARTDEDKDDMQVRCDLDLNSGSISVTKRYLVMDELEPEEIERDFVVRKEILEDDAQAYKKGAEIGELIDITVPFEKFQRVTARNVLQKVKELLQTAERLKVSKEYEDKIGQLMPAQVLRDERRNIIVQLPSGEGILPKEETPHPNRHRPGDRLKLLITKVDLSPKNRGHMVFLSRSHPDVVRRLFEQEVPEIADKTVEILSVAREAGVRSKIAVFSKNPDVDPVGACVGMKGNRVQMVVRELDGERIDIVPWDADQTKFIAAALSPAKVLNVVLDDTARSAEVLVAKGNLSLAIGKRGQNARLAAKLTGWKINIRSEEEDAEMATSLATAEIDRRYLSDFLNQIDGLPAEAMQMFDRQEFNTVEKLASCDAEKLGRLLNNPELGKNLKESAAEYQEALKEMRSTMPEPEDADDEEQA